MRGFLEEVVKPLAGILLFSLFLLFVVIGIIAGLHRIFGPTPEQKEQMRIPAPISSADGCTVYRFEDNGTHYFTRCGSTVTTTRNYTESCGKACSRNRQEVLTTEGNK